MNTPVPPKSAPPPALPTLGAMLGSMVGSVVVAKGALTDPVVAASVLTGITGLFTAVFHWLGAKIGQSW